MPVIYRFVHTVPSKSNPDKSYTIKMNNSGDLTCNCPSWVFKNRGYNSVGKRTCKHTDEIINSGWQPDTGGKIITVTMGQGDWGAMMPHFCNAENCDDCSLRFTCFTEQRPTFEAEVLKEAGVL